MIWLFWLFLLAILLVVLRRGLNEAVSLNLTVRGCDMAKVNDTLQASIAPKNAAGAPAPVFNVLYEVDGGYTVSPSPDGLSAILVAVGSGTGYELTVTAFTKSGASLVEVVALPDIEAPVDEEAVSLNVTVQNLAD